MQTIWKYILEAVDQQFLELPLHTEILSVANQGDNIVLYALVNPEIKTTKNHRIEVYGTGHQIQDSNLSDLKFLGTVLMYNGSLVFHVFYN
jgi:hypothetical protein